MNELLARSLTDAWTAFSSDVSSVPLDLWDEHTFRFFLARAILASDPSVVCESEWDRHDLIIVRGCEAAIVELKFNVKRFSIADVHGCRRSKGGAGASNFREFCDCVRKLGQRSINSDIPTYGLRVVGCYLVLVYGDGVVRSRANAYAEYYDNIRLPPDLSDFFELHQRLLLDGVECAVTANKLQCKLLELRPRKVS